ncbi:hypothetical protein T12_11322 [Trichinella patagoniensis]|uniref:Uncharacterized protein n=1 Tax=Trichinella patagoniensis TaxID=990121 RepID=A0A0V0ZWE6_9BILA|nr:hypothetical protein T12_11322 [Trichinella patagoniensis]
MSILGLENLLFLWGTNTNDFNSVSNMALEKFIRCPQQSCSYKCTFVVFPRTLRCFGEVVNAVDDQVTDSSSVRRCMVAGCRAAHRDLLHFDSATKQSWLPMTTHFEELYIPVVLTTMMVTEEAPTLLTRMEEATDGEKYKLDLPWIDQTPKSPAGHGLVSPKGEQPKSSRLHFNHVTLRGGWAKLKITRDESFWPDLRCVWICTPSLQIREITNSPNRRLSSLSSFFEWNELAGNQLMCLQLAINMVRVHDHGGGSSTPLSTPSNNRARSAQNRNAYC